MIAADEECFEFRASVALVLRQGNEVLLLLRQGTGFADGQYGVVGGLIDGKERASDAMIREAKEEAGIIIDPKNLHFSCVLHSREPDHEYINFFYICDTWQNEITNLEPHYCAELRFFPLDRMPDNMVGYIRHGIMQSIAGLPYGEYGWDARS